MANAFNHTGDVAFAIGSNFKHMEQSLLAEGTMVLPPPTKGQVGALRPWRCGLGPARVCGCVAPRRGPFACVNEHPQTSQVCLEDVVIS